MLRAKLGLISIAMRNPIKCSNTPKATNTKAEAHTATSTFLAVMEMVRTEAVGPDTHINCIDCSGKFISVHVSFLTHKQRIVGSSPPSSHLNFSNMLPSMTKVSSFIKVNLIELNSCEK
jgi:hypothetical protein